MSGLSALQPYRFCVRTARPPFRELLMYCSFLQVRFRGWWLRRRRNDGRERVLRPALAEAGEEGQDEQRQPPVVGARAGGDRNVEQAAVEGERDRHGERSTDQRPQAAEEEGVRPADVVLELELAAVDPLHHAHDRAGGAGNEGGDRSGPADRQPRGRNPGDDEEDGGDAAEVDEPRLEGGAGRVVGSRGRGIGLAGLAGTPPVVMRVDELAEARWVRRGSRLRRNVPHRPDVAQWLDQLGHPTPRFE